jgi:hypothetical protein
MDIDAIWRRCWAFADISQSNGSSSEHHWHWFWLKDGRYAFLNMKTGAESIQVLTDDQGDFVRYSVKDGRCYSLTEISFVNLP